MDRGTGQENGTLRDHGGSSVRNRDSLADTRAPQGFPLAKHFEQGVRLARDLVLREMGNHLLEHRGFLLALELGNEEGWTKICFEVGFASALNR